MRHDTFIRMAEELEQLDDRIHAIDVYLYPHQTFGGVKIARPMPDGDAKDDLLEQERHMRAYRDVLARRIARHAKDL